VTEYLCVITRISISVKDKKQIHPGETDSVSKVTVKLQNIYIFSSFIVSNKQMLETILKAGHDQVTPRQLATQTYTVTATYLPTYLPACL
jgi:hypothetical protein